MILGNLHKHYEPQASHLQNGLGALYKIFPKVLPSIKSLVIWKLSEEIDKKRTEGLPTAFRGGHTKVEDAGSRAGALLNGLCY